jgi:hypothetical protein
MMTELEKFMWELIAYKSAFSKDSDIYKPTRYGGGAHLAER